MHMIKHVWIEHRHTEGFDPKQDSTDVLVQTDDGLTWTASFATIPYLQRQMALSYDVAEGMNMPPVRFIALETPHVVVENLLPDTIEDAVDNLMMLGIFESVFTQFSDDLAHAAPEEAST